MAKSSRSDRRARVEAMRQEQRKRERRSSFLIYGLGSFVMRLRKARHECLAKDSPL